MGTTARALTCERCQAAFSLVELVPRILCPYCGHQQSVHTLHGDLQTYRHDVNAQVRAAEAEYEKAAGWERWAGPRNPLALWKAVGNLVTGSWVAVGLTVFALVKLGALDPERHAWLVVAAVGSILVPLTAIVVWFRACGRRVEVRTVALGETLVACPRCGAPGKLTPGEVADLCAYCTASLLPSRTVVLRGIDAAREAHRRAAMTRRRAERRERAKAIQMPKLHRQLAFGTFGTLVLTLYGRRKQKAWERALTDLGRQFGGHHSSRIEDWVGWLNQFWVGELEQDGFLGHHAAAVDACGFPALVVAHTGKDQFGGARSLEIYLAAWVPGLSDGAGGAVHPAGEGQAAQRFVESRGFRVALTEAGVRASAHRETVARIHRDPVVVHELAPILAALAAVAASAGAEPVAPIP